jgi:hypothetical protein
LLFHFADCFLCHEKILSLIYSHLFIFCFFVVCAFSIKLKRYCQRQYQVAFSLSYSRGFKISGFMFSPFWIDSVYVLKKGSILFYILHVDIHFFSISFFEESVISSLWILGTLVKNWLTNMHQLLSVICFGSCAYFNIRAVSLLYLQSTHWFF